MLPFFINNIIAKQEYNKLKDASSNAYEIAVNGGKNSGLLNNVIRSNLSQEKILKSLESLEKVAMKHINYVINPKTYDKYQEFVIKTDAEKINTINYWTKEAVNYVEQANVLRGLLEKLNK